MSQRLKAVVIDDVAWCRELLTEVLQARGYEVSCYAKAESLPFCTGGKSCLSTEACADLLLTDNRMPMVTGLEMLETQLGKGCKLCHGDRAVLSGSWTLAETEQAKTLGCKVFAKPYDLGALDAWLDECEKNRPASSGFR